MRVCTRTHTCTHIEESGSQLEWMSIEVRDLERDHEVEEGSSLREGKHWKTCNVKQK